MHAMLKTNTLFIPEPSIVFLNLGEELFKTQLSLDVRTLSPLFTDHQISNGPIPKCDILFVYCRLNPNGKIPNYNSGINRAVKMAHARIGVVASENRKSAYVKVMQRHTDWDANMIYVSGRSNENLGDFFYNLFDYMFQGRSLLSAWEEITSDNAENTNIEQPDMKMVAKAGDIVFAEERPGFWKKIVLRKSK